MLHKARREVLVLRDLQVLERRASKAIGHILIESCLVLKVKRVPSVYGAPAEAIWQLLSIVDPSDGGACIKMRATGGSNLDTSQTKKFR